MNNPEELLDPTGVDLVCAVIEAAVYIVLGLVAIVGLYTVGAL